MRDAHLFNVANQGRPVLVNSKKYKGVAIYTGCDWYTDSVYVRVGTKHYEIETEEILRFLPEGKLTGAIYG